MQFKLPNIKKPGIKKRGGKNKIVLPSKYLLIIVGIVCAVLIFVSYNSNLSTGPMKVITTYVFVPIQKGINNIGAFFTSKADYFKDLEDVIDENEKLKDEIARLTEENSNLQLEHYEYLRLLDLQKLDETYKSYDKQAARVIGRSVDNWFNEFVIDKGTNDGLQVNMNVIAGKGLVGRITETGKNWSTVRSIIDDTSNVSAMDLTTQDICVVCGSLEGMTNEQVIEFNKLRDTDANVAVGDQLVTSAVSDVYLEGLLIGYITEVTPDTNGLTYSGKLSPVVDFEHLSEVLVITELKETGEADNN